MSGVEGFEDSRKFVNDSSDFREGINAAKEITLPKNDGGITMYYDSRDDLTENFWSGVKKYISERGYNVGLIERDEDDKSLYLIRVEKEFN